jgi:hypothetical protein
MSGARDRHGDHAAWACTLQGVVAERTRRDGDAGIRGLRQAGDAPTTWPVREVQAVAIAAYGALEGGL